MVEFDPEEHFADDRLEKLEELREAGVEAYPPDFEQDMEIGEFVDRFGGMDSVDDDATYSLTGRITRINDLGDLYFVDLTDSSGTVQSILNQDTEGVELFDKFDESDFIEVTGEAIYSESGELSLLADDFRLLTKALNHPPSRDGLNEKSTYATHRPVAFRYDEVQEPIRKRFEMTRVIRDYLDSQGYLEVETPVLQSIYGGARAEPFTTRLDAKDQEMFLRISPELYLKRMVVGGFEKIYEISKVFRNEGIDPTHNPEFTLLELYAAYADYEDMMEITENVIVEILDELYDGNYVREYAPRNSVVTEDHEFDEDDVLELDFTPPWRRMTMTEAITEYTDESIDVTRLSDEDLGEKIYLYGIDEYAEGYDRHDVAAMSEAELRDVVVDVQSAARDETAYELPEGLSRLELLERWAGEYGVEFENRGLGIETLFELTAEEKIMDPTFIIDHPKETISLCKGHRDKEGKIERFELFIAGNEMANAYTELNDPVEQGERLAEQASRYEAGAEEAERMDEDFVHALSYGMPPSGGLGIGIGRLAKLLTNRHPIKDVLAFPLVSTDEE